MRACSASSSIRISPTPRSSSVADTGRPHPLCLDDSRDRDDLVTAHHERPAFAVGARDLCVAEHVLQFLPAAGESVAGAPPPYCKPWQLGFDTPRSPVDAAAQRDRAALEPEPVVLAHGLEAAAEVDATRGQRLGEEARERRAQRLPLVERAQEVLARSRMELLQQREDLLSDQAALRVRVRRVGAPLEPVLTAVRLRVLAPDA